MRLSGRRASHLLGVLKVGRGDVLEGACINQGPCELVVEDLESDKVILKVGPVQLKELSKEQAKISLVVALPRPQMFKRVLQVSAQFGVADITFVGSERVEKSFFQSKELEPDRIRENLVLGLEQSLRFKLPSIEIVPNLRRFFKEISFKPSSLRILAHPGDWPRLCDFNEKPGGSFILAIGPEGGWLEQEVQSFMSHGFQAASISNNILRVDQAVTVGLSQLEFLAPESEVSGYQCSQSSEGVNIPNSKGSFFTSIRSAS